MSTPAPRSPIAGRQLPALSGHSEHPARVPRHSEQLNLLTLHGADRVSSLPLRGTPLLERVRRTVLSDRSFGKALHVAGCSHPGQRVVAKYLACRRNRFWVVERADVEDHSAWRISGLLCDRRAAFRAEMSEDWFAAAAEAGERFYRTVDRQPLLRNDEHGTKRATSESLAVAAMTQPRYNRIRQCGVTHRAAETRACQLGHCFLGFPSPTRQG